MAIEISSAFLEPYFTGKKKHPGYDDAKKLYDALRIHANGEYPSDIIDERRPSESDKIKAYRKKIFIPVTKETMTNVITSLSKIRRSSDWSVKFDKQKAPANIPEAETLEAYTMMHFPYYKSFEAWVFSVLLKSYLIDANALVVIVPINAEIKQGEYLKPYPLIYHADEVVEFIPEELAIIKKEKTVIVITPEVIETYEENKERKYVLTNSYPHGLGALPAFKTGGMFLKAYEKDVVHESRIQSLAPRLNEVSREYSDLQAEVVQHIHSEKWIYATQSCPDCSVNGVSSGRRIDKNKKEVICRKCNGSGTVATSPYTQIVVNPKDKRFGETEVPIPPAGYIQKQIDIVKIQDERIDKHVLKALASINMQFLMETPLSQSGIAKEVDRDELNNFVYSVAEDIVALMEKCYWLFAEYRYRVLIQSETERNKLLPDIAVPEKFDLLSSVYLADEISKAVTAKVNGVIISALQVEYASKKFYNNPEIKDELVAVLSLDPLPGLSEDEKMTRLSNGGVEQVDYVISCNIVQFVKRAVFEKKNEFYAMPMDKQLELMRTYAEQIMASINATKVEQPAPEEVPAAA